eukprot:TRINITY_DN8519_c0_g1_i6.p2 TRINITY_DN8519_c0_g1~~TRINITY_DN8519_c0_g1_i6.p2  ORF type:complete len:116 (-),score=11.20 TRINITY_DN8519_c0_g1_i6:377-724(-)
MAFSQRGQFLTQLSETQETIMINVWNLATDKFRQIFKKDFLLQEIQQPQFDMKEKQKSQPFIQKLIACKNKIIMITNSRMVLQLNLKTKNFRNIQTLESKTAINCFHNKFWALDK